MLAGIPGWQHADYRDLSGGETNRTYLVEADGRRAVLKIDARPRAAPYNRRAVESVIQKSAAGAGLAGNVLYADETVILTEYVDGEVWTADDLDDFDNLDRLAMALRKLHSLPLTGRVFDAATAARDYARRLDGADPLIARQCLDVVESMRAPRNLCCCHNDLVAANIVSAGEIRFLDWEYACDNDPFFDLATIVAHHELPTGHAERLLDAYFDGDGRRWHAQLVAQERHYDALNWLWRASRRVSGD